MKPAYESTSSSPYYNALPNDGIFVNPMRNNFSPPSPCGTESSESFFLHDPHEVIYNRVRDVFESDTSVREESIGKINAMTVQAEIHSSSSGTVSDDDTHEMIPKNAACDKNNNNNYQENEIATFQNSNHDYEDIYLVREEAKIAKVTCGRSRSRDSGSHSRSASTSSTRSHEIIIQTNMKIIVSYYALLCLIPIKSEHLVLYLKKTFNSQKSTEEEQNQTIRYEKPKSSISEMNQNHRMLNIDSTYECVEPPDEENYKIKAHHQVIMSSTSPTVKVDAPPLPPPLPQWNHHSGMNNRMQRNYRNSDDSLNDHANSDQVNGKFL